MAKAARKSIPETIQVSVLVESRRRCAMCFHLHDDFSVCEGQLAHVDRDPSNDAEDNLVYLCLTHHNQYDTRPSQAKRWLPAELAEIKRRFIHALAEGRHVLGQQPAVRGQETDRKALVELQATMQLPLQFLRGVSFADHSFAHSKLDGLNEVANQATGPEHEFIDRHLEMLRCDLVQAAETFLSAVYSHTRWRTSNQLFRAVPRAWEEEKPERFQKAVTVLDAAAVKVCDAYDALVRLGRARLLP